MANRHRRKTRDETDLVVELTCRWCGQPITLTLSALGPQVEDVEAFMAVHGRCLARAAEEAREEQAGDQDA